MEIHLPSYSTDGSALVHRLHSSPASGTIKDMSSIGVVEGDTIADDEYTDSAVGHGVRVVYTRNTGSDVSVGSDNFTYVVTDGTSTVTAPVVIMPFRIPTPEGSELSVMEDSLGWAILGLLGYDNMLLDVIVTQMPSKGTLYHAGLDGPSYSQLATSTSGLVPIRENGTMVNNIKGVIQVCAGKRRVPPLR